MDTHAHLISPRIMIQRHFQKPQFREAPRTIHILSPNPLAHAVCSDLIFHIAQILIEQQNRIAITHLQH